MAHVFDVAAYILERRGPMTTMKLQELVYYSQAWSTVWDDNVLFNEAIEAWKNGPVVRELWQQTRGQFRVSEVVGGNPMVLTPEQRNTIDSVLNFYGDKDAQWLSDLTHLEAPWREAYALGQNSVISPETLVEYYSTIGPDQ